MYKLYSSTSYNIIQSCMFSYQINRICSSQASNEITIPHIAP